MRPLSSVVVVGELRVGSAHNHPRPANYYCRGATHLRNVVAARASGSSNIPGRMPNGEAEGECRHRLLGLPHATSSNLGAPLGRVLVSCSRSSFTASTLGVGARLVQGWCTVGARSWGQQEQRV